MERSIVEQAAETMPNLRFYGIPSGKLRRYFSWQNFSDVFKTLAGIFRSYFLLGRLKARAVFSKGGFVAVPVVIAARLRKIPVICHESDLDPGLASKISLRFSELLCLPYEESRYYFAPKWQGRLAVTGNPLRREFTQLDHSKHSQEPEQQEPLILVLGGSLGAQQINCAIWDLLPQLCQSYYIIHQCGEKGYPEALDLARQYPHYQPHSFIGKDIAQLYQRASLIICRAGAGTLWEVLASSKPALLIPLVKGSRGDQVRNARLFAQKSWAYYPDLSSSDDKEKLDTQNLLAQINAIMQDEQVVPAAPPKMNAAHVIANILSGLYSEDGLPRTTKQRQKMLQQILLNSPA